MRADASFDQLSKAIGDHCLFLIITAKIPKLLQPSLGTLGLKFHRIVCCPVKPKAFTKLFPVLSWLPLPLGKRKCWLLPSNFQEHHNPLLLLGIHHGCFS